ncbi:TPA: hypothetical protein IBW26_001929 [Escherichia coli]|nr:hypothetical protein [Escherichia coli]
MKNIATGDVLERIRRLTPSHVTAPFKTVSPLWLSASSSACHGVLIITVITPSPTKNSATKMPEN